MEDNNPFNKCSPEGSTRNEQRLMSTTARFLPHIKTKPYIERVKHRPKPEIPEHVEIHRSLEFVFDPGDFISGPSEIVARVCDHAPYG